MFDAISTAVRRANRLQSQAFLVASYWSNNGNTGVILVNLQDGNGTYAVWNVDNAGVRSSGFYTGDYSQAMELYNNQFIKLRKFDGVK